MKIKNEKKFSKELDISMIGIYNNICKMVRIKEMFLKIEKTKE